LAIARQLVRDHRSPLSPVDLPPLRLASARAPSPHPERHPTHPLAPIRPPHPDSAPDTSARPEAGCRIPDVRSAMPLRVGGVRTGGEGPVRGLGTALERPQGAGVGVAVVSTG